MKRKWPVPTVNVSLILQGSDRIRPRLNGWVVSWLWPLVAVLFWTHIAHASEQNELSAMPWRQLTIQQGLLSDHVNLLLADSGNLYIGTPKGLNVYTPLSQQMVSFTASNGLPHDNVLSLLPDGAGVWIGTEKGLGFYQDHKITPCLQPEALLGLQINSLTKSGDRLILGTNTGLLAFLPRRHQVETIKATQGQKILCVKKIMQGLLYSCQDGQIFLYDEQTNIANTIEMEFNALKHPANGILSTGDCIWFSTEGSGLVGYDVIKKEWVSLTKAMAMDTFISAVVADGDYLWFGSFAGLYCYQQINKKWWLLEDERFTGSIMSSLAIMDNQLWVGTQGRGIVYGEKPWPTISLDLPKRYYEQEKASLKGTLQGSAPFKTQLTYEVSDCPKVILSEHTKISNSASDYQAEIDFSALNDNVYNFNAQVIDAQGRENSIHFSLGKQVSPLNLDFEKMLLRPGGTHITGKYRGDRIRKIIFYPGAIVAKLTPGRQEFEAVLSLQAGDKYLKVEIYDNFEKTKICNYKIHVVPLPNVKLAPDSDVFSPNYEAVNFKLESTAVVDMDRCQLIVSDAGGNTVYVSTPSAELLDRLSWNGCDQQGCLVAGGQLFYCQLHVKEKNGFEFMTPKQPIRSRDTTPAAKIKRIPVPEVFYFDSGKAIVKPQQQSKINNVFQYVSDHPKANVLLEGHTDDVPIHTSEYSSNQQLSYARAENVAALLAATFQIADDRLMGVGYGQLNPKFSNLTFSGQKKNRCVRLFVLEKE